MNAKILTALGSLMLVSSMAMAQMGDSCGMKNAKGCGCDDRPMMKKEMMQKKHHQKDRFMGMVMRLELSDEQRTAIQKLMDENRKNRVSPFDAFSETKFDKELYIKLSEEKRAMKLQKRADMMEKVYALLTKEQKKELKALMNQKQEMRLDRPKKCDMR